jgi:hypothetical protein
MFQRFLPYDVLLATTYTYHWSAAPGARLSGRACRACPANPFFLPLGWAALRDSSHDLFVLRLCQGVYIVRELGARDID